MQSQSIVIYYDASGLGDLLAITPFFKDFAEQHPDKKLYFSFKQSFIKDRYISVFDNNPNFRLYQPGTPVDAIVKFRWGDPQNYIESRRLFDKNAKYIDNFYCEFCRRSGLKVVRRTSCVDVYLSDEEKSEVEQMVQQKTVPICLVNGGYHPIFTTPRNWGWENFQQVVDALHDKIQFIQFGSRNAGFFHRRLSNCLDMLDKTNIRDIIKLMLVSDFVLSNDSSPYHFASIDAPYCKRTVVTVLGGKAPYEYLNCYNPLNVQYELLYNNDQFKSCYQAGNYACDVGFQYFTAIKLPSNLRDTRMCGCPVCNKAGQIVSSCMMQIRPEDVVARIEKHL